jgi:hypothetical protein
VAITGLHITAGVAGDRFDIRVTIPDVPPAQVLTKAWFTAKINPTDLDVDALVSKVVTTVANADGQLTDTGSVDLIGEAVFALTPTDTRAIHTNGVTSFDVQVLTDAGYPYTVITESDISFHEEVTLATS